MKSILKSFATTAICSMLCSMAFASPEPITVPDVDLGKYQGLWYEIARLPNSFQEQCVGNVTAEYRGLKNSQVQVINRCQKLDGQIEMAEGRAKAASKNSNSKLKVTFAKILGKWLFAFSGDYWVIGLDKEYRWSLVGTGDRKYAWILSRTPDLSSRTLENISKLLTEQGYDPCKLLITPQNGGRGSSRSLCEAY